MHTVATLARAAGVPASTIRFYERKGLLMPCARTRSRYRQYGEPALERLRFIRAAQAAGLTLDDTGKLLGLRDEPTAGSRCVSVVQGLLAARLAEIESRLAELTQTRDALRRYLGECRAGAASGHCAVLDRLTVSACGQRDGDKSA